MRPDKFLSVLADFLLANFLLKSCSIQAFCELLAQPNPIDTRLFLSQIIKALNLKSPAELLLELDEAWEATPESLPSC